MLLIDNLKFSQLLENDIGKLVVHLNFSDLVIWPNRDIRRSVSLPKLKTSDIPIDLVEQKGDLKKSEY